MKLKELTQYLDSEIPLSFQVKYDNSGLQVGDPEKVITSALLTLDVTDEVLDEAIENAADLIISHHPVIFKGIISLSGKTYTERIILKAIRNDVAIYSAHTNLDMVSYGVSRKMAEKLNLQDVRVLVPLKEKLLKLVTYIPESHLDVVREAVFSAGSGVIGNYDSCSFTSQGKGSFRGGENTNPFAGEKGKLHFETEIRFETVLLSHLKDKVIKALIEAHPYEEVAYDIYSLVNNNVEFGMGCIGELPVALPEMDFLKLVSDVFNSRGIRYSRSIGRELKKISLCGGAGSSLLNDAISSGADAFVTADIKYHNFFDAENRILMIDSGHYESEKYSTEILYDLIIKKFPKFAVRFSKTNTNPINYL
ncbi:MAG: Nif3-like dinuclear metal center hexameric protein [Bacteroidetes bacterium GWE2_41_25]|nr:MAG: Nif3-like dinuclear metal center hexameric protein [Bacteroidetes bacterium GWA2_40_15]OFX89743.1 MAG: Nif3-like dinuclear metal center hexameric protein [Bacteroidetes bacterium GWC2_40_22]OFY00629.1 MAG: Nif3-like dinuclear metal center hexameric protein [Bacteroidetes bacterium GWE2_41_25]HAM09102.1 Nif3-like dinuclear metal center hexameric protein [Bacteroidales bacterium]HBH84105.1 Nif3-like dinuclear metal center hexameric protein [Bacteroidales bacterium]